MYEHVRLDLSDKPVTSSANNNYASEDCGAKIVAFNKKCQVSTFGLNNVHYMYPKEIICTYTYA